MANEEAGSCRENGLFGFLGKMFGKSIPTQLPEVLSDKVSDDIKAAIKTAALASENSLWDPNSELDADPLEKKGLTADPSAAYGLFGFMGTKYDKNGNYDSNGSPLKLVMTGKFPKAQYMSLQIYRGKPLQTSKDVGGQLSDYRIQPKTGINPFQSGNRNDSGTFEITITPDTNMENAPNHIYYQAKDQPEDAAVITGFYRVYLPDGKKFAKADLPKISAFDSSGNEIKPKYVPLVDTWFPNIPGVKLATNMIVPDLTDLPWLNLDCVTSDASGLGSSKDVHYIGSLCKVPVGKYVVVKFRAPAVYFGPQESVEAPAVRYWSICPVYFPGLVGLNSLASDPSKPAARDVTLVFGKDRPGVALKAAKLGASFLPDTRSNDEDVLTFLLRNILPTKSIQSQVFKGRYAPSGKVYTLQEFLELPDTI
ncbi:MAG: hypothetical protein U0930_01390 [Pirellulales bacterium]